MDDENERVEDAVANEAGTGVIKPSRNQNQTPAVVAVNHPIKNFRSSYVFFVVSQAHYARPKGPNAPPSGVV